MSAHLDRARLLLAQSRPADAELEAGRALLQQPDDPMAHVCLALSRIDQGKKDEALESARTAVGLAPDAAYTHYILGLVLHRLDDSKAALAATHEAIRLDPGAEDSYALLAAIEMQRRDWQAALTAAEQGLALNPEHVQSANFRAMALVRLGRRAEAMATVDYALERAPDNALSHANQGWNRLHSNDPRQAQDHFREALRLDPNLEYARQGMLEALKARNPVYRGMLAYFLWMGRQSDKLQWLFIIGTFVGVRVVRSLAEKNEQLGWFLWPLVVLFYVFVYLSWTAGPMFNLLLRLDRFGRLVLSREETIASNWFAVPLLGALGAGGWWLAGGGDVAMFSTIAAAMLSVCVAALFHRTGRARRILAWLTVALALLAILGIGQLLIAADAALLTLFFIGFLGYQIAANTLRS